MSLLKSIAVLAAVLLAALPWSSASGQSLSKTQKAQVEASLKTQFIKQDLNHDGSLDKAELARAFRGPKATPPRQDLYDDRGNPTPVYYQARTKYPELVYLWAADTNADGLVSLPEYQAYGLKMYTDQQQQMRAQQQQQLAQRRAVQSANRRASRAPVRRNYRRPARHTTYRRRPVYYARRRQYQANTQYPYGGYSPQQQMVNAMVNWQRNMQYMQAAYQVALRRRLQMQQQMVQRAQQVMNYRRRVMAAYYRAAQGHARTRYTRSRSLGRRRR